MHGETLKFKNIIIQKKRDVHSSPSIVGETVKIRKIIVHTVPVTFLTKSFLESFSALKNK